MACVVLNAESKVNEKEIMDYVTSNVASYKRVRVVRFVKSIPKSPSGKIMRRLLGKELEESLHPRPPRAA